MNFSAEIDFFPFHSQLPTPSRGVVRFSYLSFGVLPLYHSELISGTFYATSLTRNSRLFTLPHFLPLFHLPPPSDSLPPGHPTRLFPSWDNLRPHQSLATGSYLFIIVTPFFIALPLHPYPLHLPLSSSCFVTIFLFNYRFHRCNGFLSASFLLLLPTSSSLRPPPPPPSLPPSSIATNSFHYPTVISLFHHISQSSNFFQWGKFNFGTNYHVNCHYPLLSLFL